MGLSSCISKASDGIKKAAKKQKNAALRAGEPDTSAGFQESQLKVLAKLTAKFGDIAAIDGNKEAEVELLKSVIEDLKLDRETVAIQIEQAGLKVPAMPKLTVIEGGAAKQAEDGGDAAVNADQASDPDANIERHQAAQRMYGQHRRAFLSNFSGRELREQEKFVEAAEQKFSAGRIMGFSGGKTVHVTDSMVDASGSVRVFLMGPSGNFTEVDTVPIEETALYKGSAVDAAKPEETTSKTPYERGAEDFRAGRERIIPDDLRNIDAIAYNKGYAEAKHEAEYIESRSGKEIVVLPSEFPLDEVDSSYSHISHMGASRARSDRDAFVDFVNSLYDEAVAGAETDAQREAAKKAAIDFKNEYLLRLKPVVRTRSQTYSGHIAGGANLNANQANRRNSALDRALDSFAAWQKVASKKVKQAVLDARNQSQLDAEPNESAGNPEMDAPKVESIATVDSHGEFTTRLNDGKVTIDEFKARFESLKNSKGSLLEELNKKTKAELLGIVGGHRADRMKNDKKDRIVDVVYRSMLDDFVLGDSISYGFGSKYEDVIGNYVAGYSQADIDSYAERVKNARAEREQRANKVASAVKDPQDFAEYKVYIQSKMAEGITVQQARMTLPADKRAMFDDEMAEASRNARGERKEVAKTQVQAAAQTTAGQLFETKHTKTGEPLFVVKTADRVDRQIFDQWNSTAKRLGGRYSSYRGNGAIPGFTFKTKESADAFMQYLGGDAVAAQDAIKADRDAFSDDKAQTAVERLNEMADRLDANADSVLSADRKTNTERRARFAASAEAAANSSKAMAQTMRNIANAISDGTAKFLDMVRQKAQVEMLRSRLEAAKMDEAKAQDPNGWYTKELHKGSATIETADFATWPTYTAYRSDLARMGRELLQIDGGKRIGQQVLKFADDITDAYKKFAKENLHKVSTFATSDGNPAVFTTAEKAEEAIARSGFKGQATTISFKRGEHRIIMGPEMAREKGLWAGDDDKRITLPPELGEQIVTFNKSLNKRTQDIRMPWVFDNVSQERARWKSMGIETPAEMRAALREFVGLNEKPKEADKIKEMERAMIGRRNDGLDFFPTSKAVVQEMLDAAEIEPGMSVLEPSAGIGHIAEQIRTAGVDPDVVELSADRRELLEAKGFNVVGTDFTDIKPRTFFTFGDVFKAPDGTVGVMRGSGGLGSNSARLTTDERDSHGHYVSLGWFKRDELVGVEKRGLESGYDRIIMNPPFSNRRDAEHVQHAYTLLRPGGRIVAIMGEGVFYGQDAKAVQFREWLESVGGTSEKLPEGSFLDPSLPVNTAVNARMVVIDKREGGPSLNQTGVQGYYEQYQQRAIAFNNLPAGAVLRQSDSIITGRAVADGNAGWMEDGAGEASWNRYSSIANGVAEDFKTRGLTTLVGKKIETPLDLAIAAQVYRDPRIETARYFLVKDGVIVGQTGVSSRKPGVTKALFGDTAQEQLAFIDDVEEQAKSLGADSIWMLHNHPDGKPTPSRADMEATDRIAGIFERRGLKVPHHVIINHNSYGVVSIERNGMMPDVKVYDFGDAAGYDITKPRKHHSLLGQHIGSPVELAAHAKMAQVSSGQIVIIGLSGGSGIRTINEITPAQLRGKFGAAILRRIAKQTGSDRLFAYGVSPDDIGSVREAIKTGLLVDAIVIDNGIEQSVAGMPGTESPMSGYSLGTKDVGYRVEQGGAPSVDRATIESIVIDNFRSIIENMKSAKKLTEDCK